VREQISVQQTREIIMSHVSYRDLRNNLAKYMDEVGSSRAPLHVTRQNSSSVVMLSEADYEQMLETLHLLRSPANAARLLRSINEANNGALLERDLIAPEKKPA
jgi:antitoxin YefM